MGVRMILTKTVFHQELIFIYNVVILYTVKDYCPVCVFVCLDCLTS